MNSARSGREARRLGFSLKTLLAGVLFAGAIFGAYRAGYRKGEVDALKVPLRHNADRNLMQGQLRLLASDTREPVPYCYVDFILIGPDGGDGGFQIAASDRRGIVKLPRTLSAGRYQIEIDPSSNPSQRYRHTSYHTDEGYLMIRSDKTYSPYEYLVDVQPNSDDPPGE